jgi:hypothetical protein
VALHTIIVAEYPVRWPTLVDEILQLMKSNDLNSTYASLLVLQELLRTYKFSVEDEHKTAVNNIISRTFSVLGDLFNFVLSSDGNDNEQAEYFAHMRLAIVKIFWNAYSMGTPAYFFSRADDFDKWMNLLMKLCQKPVAADKDEHSAQWKTNKWIGHIAYRLLMMYINPTVLEVSDANAEATEKFSIFFLEKYAVPWLTIYVGLLDSFNKGKTDIPRRVVSLALTYLHGIVQSQSIYEKTLKSQLQYIIQHIVFPFLCFNAADAESWENDPQEYLREAFEVDSSEDIFSPKAAAASTLIDLIKIRKNDALTLYLQFINTELNKYNSQQPQDRNYSLKDGILYSIGCLRSTLRKNKLTKNSLEGMLVTHVFPEFENPRGFLRARAAWILGQFANIAWSNPDTMMTSMKKILNCLGDNQLPVKIAAGLALTEYLTSPEALQEVKPILPQLLQVYMNNMDEMEHTTVVNSIEMLIDAFHEEMEPYALTIIQKMVETFIRLFDDDDTEEEAEFIMISCLRTILTLMGALGNKEHLFGMIEKAVYPIVHKILSDDGGLEFISEGLEILTGITFRAPILTKELWALFPLMGNTYKEYAYDYIYDFVAPIDNYICKDADTFLSNPLYMEIVLYIINSYLGKETVGVEREMQHATKLASVVLQHLRGRIDTVVPKILELLIFRLSQAKSTSLKILLIDAIADALIYNAELTLRYMESTNCTASVFGLWLSTLPQFTRLYDKKVTVLGLTSVLSRDVQTLPQAVQSNIGRIIITCVKLLMNMHTQKIQEEQDKQKQEQEREEFLKGYENGYFGDSDDDDDDDVDVADDGDAHISRQLHDTEGIDITSVSQSNTFKQLLAKISKTSWDDQADDDDLDEEDGEFNSGVDDMNENVLFGQTAKVFAEKYPDPFRQIATQLDSNEQSALQQLMTAAQ